MQNTTDLKKKEKQLTHVAFITFIWFLLFLFVPVIIYDNNEISIDPPMVRYFFNELTKQKFTVDSFIFLIIISISLFFLVISLLKINAFTKRKILDIPFFVFGLYTIASFFSMIIAVTQLGGTPLHLLLLCLLYIPVFIAYLSIRRAFVKKKKASKGKKATLPDSQKKSTKKSSNKEENAPFIHITYV